MGAKGKLRTLEGGLLAFRCPGCGMMHAVDGRWKFDGNFEAPTFSPSLLMTMPDPDNPGKDIVRCHSFVRNGMVEFLADCTHEMAGKTVPMKPEE